MNVHLITATGLLDDLENLALARRIADEDSANIDFAVDNLLIVCRHLEADVGPLEVPVKESAITRKPDPDNWDDVPVADPIPKPQKREPISIIAPAPPAPKRLVARRR